MKHFIPILFLAFILVFSCKKKDEQTPPANITTAGATTGATAGTTTGGAGATFNGICSNQKTYTITGVSAASATTALNTAFFTSAVINNFNPSVGPYLS